MHSSYILHIGVTVHVTSENLHGFIKIVVKAREKIHIEVDIQETNALLEWKFKTNDYDIKFGVSHDHGQEVIPLHRVDSHKSQQEGRHKCERLGVYKLIFDNTYSYTSSKTTKSV